MKIVLTFGSTLLPDDDLQYCEDLGLIRRKPEVAISNRIYREIMPRVITAPIQDFLHQPQNWYLKDYGGHD